MCLCTPGGTSNQKPGVGITASVTVLVDFVSDLKKKKNYGNRDSLRSAYDGRTRPLLRLLVGFCFKQISTDTRFLIFRRWITLYAEQDHGFPSLTVVQLEFNSTSVTASLTDSQ